MNRPLHQPLHAAAPMSRREVLRVGALSLGGIASHQVLAARAMAGQSSNRNSVILLYCHGGPSHLETYDLKPEAPTSYRSIFSPISTNVAGMDICELFPRQAKLADKFSIVRSMHHEMSSHSDGGIQVLTGHTPSKPDPTSTSKSEHPCFGAVASATLGMGRAAVPAFVSIPNRLYMTRPQYVGSHHGAFEAGDPSQANYRPPLLSVAANSKGMENRRELLKQLDRFRSDVDQHGELLATDRFREQAFQMLTSPAAAKAFDLSHETDDLRDRYGRHIWGQGCLLARRLAEAGTAVTTVYINTPKSGEEFTNWDDHIQNAGRPGHFAKYMRVRLPYLDQCLSTLIEDIYSRGLDQQIMVVVMGEFGRTPRLSHNTNGTGRNHWPQAYSALVAGGGTRGGQVIGATNSKGEYPTENPYRPEDLLATVGRHLGIDPGLAIPDLSGRPIAVLGSGRLISELI